MLPTSALSQSSAPNPVNGQHLHDEACEPLWDELEQLNVPIGFPSNRHNGAKGRCRTALCRARQFSSDCARYSQPCRAHGINGQHDHGSVFGAPPEAALCISRRNGRLALLVAVGAGRSMGKFGPSRENKLSKTLSEYFERQCYIALDVDEAPAVDVVN